VVLADISGKQNEVADAIGGSAVAVHCDVAAEADRCQHSGALMTRDGGLMRIGEAELQPVFEIREIVMPYETFINDTSPAEIKQTAAWLAPHFMDPDTLDCKLSQHAWLIAVNGKRILVDPCVGHQRHRPLLAFYHMIDSPLLSNLRALGVEPESVDYVFCTHLHLDHVGWNTRLENGRYVPTFPNAKYLFSRVEEAYWRRDLSGQLPAAERYNSGVFAECILPVMEAGLAQLVEPGMQFADCVTLIDSSGHTPGHLSAVLESKGEGVVLAGDAIHHPLQIAFHDRPNHAFDAERARAARVMLLELCVQHGYWLAPAHFKSPHLCRISKESRRYRPVWG
jgi:glyoxylase-like metal-dependent hydrolase (beta-lactamase superfamily II)